MASMGQKYLVVSDNHGNMSNLEYVIERFRGKIEALIHCGDMEIPPEMLEELAGCPVYMAEGNCDYNFSRDKEDIFELGDHVAFVTHGDAYGVSWGEEELVSKAQEMGADVVFYGHTHCPAFHYYEKEGVTVFNPGSIALPRQMTPEGPTFLIIDLADDGRLTPELYTL